MTTSKARVIDEGRAVELRLDGKLARFHAIWLRDNALDEKTRSATNGQRLITILDVPEDTRIARAKITSNDELSVFFMPEEREARYPVAWLATRAYDGGYSRAPGWTSSEVTRWDSALQSAVPSADYKKAASDRR